MLIPDTSGQKLVLRNVGRRETGLYICRVGVIYPYDDYDDFDYHDDYDDYHGVVKISGDCDDLDNHVKIASPNGWVTIGKYDDHDDDMEEEE